MHCVCMLIHKILQLPTDRLKFFAFFPVMWTVQVVLPGHNNKLPCLNVEILCVGSWHATYFIEEDIYGRIKQVCGILPFSY